MSDMSSSLLPRLCEQAEENEESVRIPLPNLGNLEVSGLRFFPEVSVQVGMSGHHQDSQGIRRPHNQLLICFREAAEGGSLAP